MIASLCVACAAAPSHARGYFRDDAPWYNAIASNSQPQIDFGVSYVPSPHRAVLFHTALSPWRRGPFDFAFSWSSVSVRGSGGQAFGFGDPKAFARLRAAGSDSTFAHLWAEGAARIPTAGAKLFPYAGGAQEIELQGTIGFGRVEPRFFAGCARVFAEPRTGIATTELAHAVRAWAFLRTGTGPWAAAARGDYWGLHRGGERRAFELQLAHNTPGGLRVQAAGGFEWGPRTDRVSDTFANLRFATPLR